MWAEIKLGMAQDSKLENEIKLWKGHGFKFENTIKLWIGPDLNLENERHQHPKQINEFVKLFLNVKQINKTGVLTIFTF